MATRHWKRGRLVVVIGQRMTVPKSDRFSASVETTRQGRTPFCSRPFLGSRSNIQISPRSGLGRSMGGRVFESSIHRTAGEGAQEELPLVKVFLGDVRRGSVEHLEQLLLPLARPLPL